MYFGPSYLQVKVHPGTNTSDLQQAAAFLYPLSIPQLCCKLFSCLLSCSSAAVYLHAHIFLCEEPDPHIPNTLAAFSCSKWPSLWQRLLSSKFREALSTNYERRDATAFCVKPRFDGLLWLQSPISSGHSRDLATCGLAPCAQRGEGNSFL